MKEIIMLLSLAIMVLIAIVKEKNERIKVLENNWETAKKVIGEYDPKFKAYLDGQQI